ncbi:hypothetical protein AMTRI_Chr04g185330 [Amborella trichopoda]
MLPLPFTPPHRPPHVPSRHLTTHAWQRHSLLPYRAYHNRPTPAICRPRAPRCILHSQVSLPITAFPPSSPKGSASKLLEPLYSNQLAAIQPTTALTPPLSSHPSQLSPLSASSVLLPARQSNLFHQLPLLGLTPSPSPSRPVQPPQNSTSQLQSHELETVTTPVSPPPTSLVQAQSLDPWPEMVHNTFRPSATQATLPPLSPSSSSLISPPPSP